MADDRLREIGQIALTVGDVEVATAFYRDQLGMQHLFSAPPAMAFFDCAGIRLLLGEPEGGSGGGAAEDQAEKGSEEPQRGGCVLYFDVADIGSTHSALTGRGVEFIQAPHKVAELGETELWLAFFSDPWGNTLALMSEVPKG